MNIYEKAYIYFDTNALECRHSGKSLFLSQFTIAPIYYEIEELIRNMGLTDKVEICIPDIVWLELQEHLIKHFKSEKRSMETKISNFRKSFGDLAEINCSFKDYTTESQYLDYLNSMTKGFLENPRVNAKIIPYPRNEEAMLQIIKQSIRSDKPFKAVKIGKKDYTDAGFKDALIFNTIMAHTGNQLGIFISDDDDFSELFGLTNSNLKRCTSANEVKSVLSTEFNIESVNMMEVLLSSDHYLMKRILSVCEFDENTPFYELNIVSQVNIDENVKVVFTAIIDGEKYGFEVTYNIDSKELIEASSDFFSEKEDEYSE